jgi:hypothetical protein
MPLGTGCNAGRQWALISGLVLGFACAHFGARGHDLYDQGRYIEAAHLFEMTEPRLAEANPRERAQYGLYRGATLLRLGDTHAAERWIAFAQRALQGEPDALNPAEQDLLRESAIALDAERQRRALAFPEISSPIQPTAPVTP